MVPLRNRVTKRNFRLLRRLRHERDHRRDPHHVRPHQKVVRPETVGQSRLGNRVRIRAQEALLVAQSKVQGTLPNNRRKAASARRLSATGQATAEKHLSHLEKAALGMLEPEEAHLINHRIPRQKARKTKVTNKTAT